MQTNVIGTVNVFEAVRHVRAADRHYDPMIVVACSSAQYGASLTPENVPIGEEVAPLPLHPYGVSKVAQDLLAFQYWRNQCIRCVRARIFNTTGPRKRDDVVSDFAARVARITRDGGALRVGNLETRRAIMDVRDLVSALTLLAERGEPGEAYNICGDSAWRIGDLIPLFERLAGIKLTLAPDPALFRPSDEAVIFGRNTKLKERTGWQPAVGIEATLKAVLDYELAHLPPPSPP
jgi:nucleoside-diphosphate-sugar epimerase